MLNLSARQQLVIGALLCVLLVVTRGHHFPSVQQILPTASWAVFFLAGVYLRPVWAFGVLLGLAAAVDLAAVTWGGISNFCTTPAYVGLLPAYFALWYAGHWYGKRYRFDAVTVAPLVVSAVIGTAICEIISSGSFYFYSGRIANPTVAGFLPQLPKYFPYNLIGVAFWAGIAALLHTVIVLGRRNTTRTA